MKIFVINLDGDKERLASIDAQLKRMGVEYERFPAIWAAGLSDSERRKVWNSFRWWCAVGRKIRDGELGVTASHNAIYRKMLSDDIQLACVLEDDAQLTDKFSMVISSLAGLLRADDKRILLLTNYTGYDQQEFGIKKLGQNSSAEAYVITKAAAKAMLSVNDPICVPCDHWQRFARIAKVEVENVFPVACSHGNAKFGSYSAPPGTEKTLVANLPPWRYAMHKFLRAIGKMLDWTLVRFGR